MKRALICCAAMSMSSLLPSQSLTTTFQGGIGQSGNMFDVKALVGLTIDSFDVNLDAGTYDLEVYALPANTPYLPDVNNAAAWGSPIASVTGVVSNGPNVATPLNLTLGLPVAGGSIQAFYVTVTNGSAMNYTSGSVTGALYASSPALEIYEGSGLSYPFTNNFNPRIWNGTIHYSAPGLTPSFVATPPAGPAPLAVTFTDASITSDPGGVTSWAWDFNGDGVTDATTPTATWTYNSCGSYDVTLTVTDATNPPSTTTVVGAIFVGATSSPLSDVTATMDTGASLPFDVRDHAISPLSTGGALVFGGEGPTGPNYSTYTFNGGVWTQQFPFFSPTARRGHAMALDESQQNNVLFGGVNPAGVKMPDTWTYDSADWTLQTPTSSPSARSKHAMAFDDLSGSVILLGGEDASGVALPDMWSWDGANWTELTPSTLPSARFGHGMAFDRFRNRLVLFGGSDGTHRLDDTWEWDGVEWTQTCSGLWRPGARDGLVMAYDADSQRVLVTGGETDSGCTSDVWSWDGTDWTRHDPVTGSTLPSPRRDAAIYVERFSGAVRMIGGGCGSSYLNDLWDFQMPVFSRTEVIGVGCAGSNGVPTLAVVNGTTPVVGTTVDFLYDNAPNSLFFTAAVISIGFDDTSYQGLPLPLPLGVLGLPGCHLYHSADVNQALAVPPGLAQATWSLPVPNDPSYLGQQFYFQGLHLEPVQGLGWAALSNAIGIRIGDQ